MHVGIGETSIHIDRAVAPDARAIAGSGMSIRQLPRRRAGTAERRIGYAASPGYCRPSHAFWPQVSQSSPPLSRVSAGARRRTAAESLALIGLLASRSSIASLLGGTALPALSLIAFLLAVLAPRILAYLLHRRLIAPALVKRRPPQPCASSGGAMAGPVAGRILFEPYGDPARPADRRGHRHRHRGMGCALQRVCGRRPCGLAARVAVPVAAGDRQRCSGNADGDDARLCLERGVLPPVRPPAVRPDHRQGTEARAARPCLHCRGYFWRFSRWASTMLPDLAPSGP